MEFSEIEEKSLENYVFEALGHASMCWSETPNGIFDTEEATRCGEELIKHINEDVSHAFEIVFKALREDPEYYRAWKANIAMAFKDRMHHAASIRFKDMRGRVEKYEVTPEQLYDIANDAAKYFLDLLIKFK